MASGLNKPNKQTILTQSAVPLLLSNYPVHKIPRLGVRLGKEKRRVLLAKVKERSISSISELPLKVTAEELQLWLGAEKAEYMANVVLGIDNEAVTCKGTHACSLTFTGTHSLSLLLFSISPLSPSRFSSLSPVSPLSFSLVTRSHSMRIGPPKSLMSSMSLTPISNNELELRGVLKFVASELTGRMERDETEYGRQPTRFHFNFRLVDENEVGQSLPIARLNGKMNLIRKQGDVKEEDVAVNAMVSLCVELFKNSVKDGRYS